MAFNNLTLLNYFRINDLYRLAGLFIILLLLFLPAFLDSSTITVPELKSLLVGQKIVEGNMPYSGLIDSTPPLTAWIHAIIYFVFGKSLIARHIIAFILIFIQSSFIGVMFINRKVYTENTYIPSLLFGVLHLFSPYTLALSGELFGAGVMLVTINYLFREMDFRSVRTETLLYLGVLVSLASLLAFHFILYLPLVCLVVVVFSRRDFKSLLLLLVGFLLPHVLLISIYYLNNNVYSIWNFFYLPNLQFGTFWLIDSHSLLILTSGPIAFLVLSLIVLNRDARFTKYQSQLFQIMFLWIIFSVLMLYFAQDFRPQSLISAIPAFAFFLTHFLLRFRRRRFAELSFWILLLTIVSISMLTRYQHWDQVNYNKLIVEEDPSISLAGKKLLVLEDQLSWYLKNQPATPFLNWNLSKTIFQHPDSYRNVIGVYDGLTNDPPDVIIDPHHYLSPFLKRIPVLQKMYEEKESGIYYIKPDR